MQYGACRCCTFSDARQLEGPLPLQTIPLEAARLLVDLLIPRLGVGMCCGHGCGKALCVLDEALLLLPRELNVGRKVADARAGLHLRPLLPAAMVERVMIPAVNGGLAATAADDGVAATTTTSRLRAASAERAMALAFDGGVAATAAGNSYRRAPAAKRVVGVPRKPNRDAMCTTLHRGLCYRRGVAS